MTAFLAEINDAYPALDLGLEHISLWNAGLVLFGDNTRGATDLSYGKRSRIVDHASRHGVEGLITVVGVRWTVARSVADQAVQMVFRKLRQPPPPCLTAETPVHGGCVEQFDAFVEQAVSNRPPGISPHSVRHLALNYGAEYGRVLSYAGERRALGNRIGESAAIGAEVAHAVREEMARRLADVVFRRTDLATGAHPGDDAVRSCGEIMGAELEWDRRRVGQEVDEVLHTLREHLPRASSRSTEPPENRPAGNAEELGAK
jgi:glycerol-3-phosphate dehydrogenase